MYDSIQCTMQSNKYTVTYIVYDPRFNFYALGLDVCTSLLTVNALLAN